MNRTDREINTILDDVTGEIRSENLDAAIVSGAAQRVWARISGEQAAVAAGVQPVEQLRNCDDFQALIPAYLQGALSGARTMLLEDHTRECVPCRKALKEARHGNQAGKQLEQQKAKVAISSHRMATLRWGIAAAVIVGVGLLAYPWIQRFTNSVNTLNSIVEAASGNVYRVTDNKTQTVRIGERILRGERIRTAKNAGAVLKLGDGSLIEMRERSEFSINDNGNGTTINLERGNIIVEAAKQRDRKLFVATDNALVSVTGTIFSVNNGTKGARVSVIEGEVHVEQGGKDNVLIAGQQVSTHPSIESIPVRDEVAWSRNAEQYGKMLDAVRSQIDQQVAMPGVRYSTNLLDLMPADTMIYVAIPNISEMLTQADRILRENLQQNAELREAWERESSESKSRGGIEQAIKQISGFGKFLGQEIAVGAGPDSVLVLAEMNDPAGFRIHLDQQLAEWKAAGKESLPARFIDDPLTTSLPRKSSADGRDHEDLLIWIQGNVLAASNELSTLQHLAGAQKGNVANRFASNQFHSRLSEVYRDGAGFLIGVDLEMVIGKAALTARRIERLKERSDEDDQREASAMSQIGLNDLRYFIVEVKEKDGKRYNRAVVSYQENQRGVTSWLAQPGPMGALEFISPDANIVAAFVVKEPISLIDDLFSTLKTADPKAWDDLQAFQQEQGIDLRNDFATPLGGEYAFAIDGPLLPTPSWKVVCEVDDPTHLQQSLENFVGKVNAEMTNKGKKGFAWSKSDSNGKTFYTLKSLDFPVEANYAFAYGYLVAAPSRALVENAIKYRESGYTLLQSAKFKATLPEDKQANFSAMVYQNLGSVVSPIAKQVSRAAGSRGPKGAQEAIKGLLGDKAGLAYVYALNDRMIVSVNSEDGPLGISPSDLLGLPGSSGLGHILRGGFIPPHHEAAK